MIWSLLLFDLVDEADDRSKKNHQGPSPDFQKNKWLEPLSFTITKQTD